MPNVPLFYAHDPNHLTTKYTVFGLQVLPTTFKVKKKTFVFDGIRDSAFFRGIVLSNEKNHESQEGVKELENFSEGNSVHCSLKRI